MMDRLKQAAGHTKDVANLPAKSLEMYSDFITKNAGAVGQVEGALRSLTYLIPGRSFYNSYTVVAVLTSQQAASENPKSHPNRLTLASSY